MRLGVFGGTFDPPHLGHLILAEQAMDQLRMDRILWVLTPDPPHKQGEEISPVFTRLQLLQAALSGWSKYQISRVEILRPGPHFTLDTIRQLHLDFPQDEIIYLIGGDSLRDLPKWHKPVELVQELDGLGVMGRPGARFDLETLEMKIPGIRGKLLWVDAPLIQISATEIRKRVRAGQAYRSFLPDAVYDIIASTGLYKDA